MEYEYFSIAKKDSSAGKSKNYKVWNRWYTTMKTYDKCLIFTMKGKKVKEFIDITWLQQGET